MNVKKTAENIASRLNGFDYLEWDDLVQESSLLLLGSKKVQKSFEAGNLAYAVTALKHHLLDKGRYSGGMHVPRARAESSESCRMAHFQALQCTVSINDPVGDEEYETLIACGKHEPEGLWKKIRNEKILTWIQQYCPMTDFLLETNKDETFAPSQWNTKSLVRAYMGADEIKQLLRHFGYSLTKDEKLAIQERFFNMFLHAKPAKNVTASRYDETPADFFMAM